MQSKIGVIGLGVMGKNIAKNMLNHGFNVSGFNRSFAKTQNLIDEGYQSFQGFAELDQFVNSLEKPRRIFLMVPAGGAVDAIIAELLPLLETGDIIMDGGNSYFQDTNRREHILAESGIYFYGVGVSGGEEGALHGPSIMPSGCKQIYDKVAEILEVIAAQKDGDPCCTYIGPQGSGHYVKMVHNGIEYADMQLLVEVYLFLKKQGYSNQEMAELFQKWNLTEIESYLLKITSIILAEKDPKSDQDIVDIILDVAGNKGTGRWTSIEALQQEYNASLLTAAYQARIMSNQLALRKMFNDTTVLSDTNHAEQRKRIDSEQLRRAYALAKLLAFAQGFGLYKDASDRYGWDLKLKEIAGIFRAGCIIQSHLLDDIMQAYTEDTQNIITLPKFFNQVKNNNADLRSVVLEATAQGLPLPVFSNALLYLDQLSADLLGANLIQAQRDFFGAHTYQRIGSQGFEHHQWSEVK